MTQTRGPFKLPLTSPQITGVDQVVSLSIGGMYYIPPGNYLIQVGGNTVLQWYDPLATMWRPVDGGCPNFRSITCDGANYRLLYRGGTLSSLSVSNPGSGGTNGIGPIETGTTITLAGGAIPAEAYVIVGGQVPTPTLMRAGSGFAVPPVVCCDPPPPGGIQATFVARISPQGAITDVSVYTPGAGYKSPPQFYIIPQFKYYPGGPRWPGDNPAPLPQVSFPPRWPWPAPGRIDVANVWPGTEYQSNIDNVHGALITSNPLINDGMLTGAVVVYPGAGVPSAPPPTITIAGGGLIGADVNAQVNPSGVGVPDITYIQASVN